MAHHLEKNGEDIDIVIDGFAAGIADDPYEGISDMRNMNIISVPTEASVNFKPQPIGQGAISAHAFTAATTGIFTYDGSVTPVLNGTEITLASLTGGTVTVNGVNMSGNTASVFAQTAYVITGSADVVVSSNNIAGTSADIKIGFNSNPSNGDQIAIVVNGTTTTIQFVSSIGTAAGNVLIGASTANTISNLLGLLQAPATTSATQVAVGMFGQAYFLYFTSTSGSETVGLSTSAVYWVQNATATTFTLTGQGPNGAGVFSNHLVQVPASASGTFSTSNIPGLFTQIVPNDDSTVYYGIDTNGLVWAYNITVANNWVYLGNTASAATKPDFNTGIAFWNSYIFALYDGPSNYQLYTRSMTDPPSTTITSDVVAATDLFTITDPASLAAAGIVNSTPLLYTASSHGGLVINTTYYASVISTTTFKVYTDPALMNLVNITADTSGVPFSLLPVSYQAWNPFKTLEHGPNTHRTFVDKNYTLYWCDGNQIGSLIELTTFDPTDSATYTYSVAALLIQTTDVAQCMDQLGTNLIIGGIYNQAYVWDRFSTGYNPLLLPENNLHRIVTVNSNSYLFMGNRGRIYVTNGANVELFKKVPDHLSGTIEPVYAWGGATYNKNQLYFGVSAFQNTLSSVSAIVGYGGIWAIDTNTQAMRIVNKLSYDTYGGYLAEMCNMQSTATATSGIKIQNFGLIASWEDSTSSSSPVVGTDVLPVNTTPALPNVPYSNYESYIDSDMIPIGTYLDPDTDVNVEFKLAAPIVAGEGVKLAYRQILSDNFTDITNGEFTTAGTYAGVCQVNFQKSQWLQIRTYTKSTNTTPSFTRLKEIRIRH